MITSILIAPCLAAALSVTPPTASPPPSAPLTLAEAVAAARVRSARREAAAALAAGARAASRLAGRWQNPTLELRTENVTAGGWRWTPPDDSRLGPPLDAFAVLNQSVELGGKRASRRALAGAEALAAEASLAQVERTVVVETVRHYIEALRARETLRALESHREALAVHQQAMDARVREGVAPASDLAKFQAEAGRLRALEARSRIELDRSLGLLAALIGESAPIGPERLVSPAQRPAVAGDATTLTAAAVERSPDVLLARAVEARAAKALGVERARAVPDLNVAGGYKRTAGFDSAVLGVSVALPIFDRNGAAIAAATGEARAAASDRAGVEGRVAAEARTALEAARLLDERARHADDDVLKPAGVVRDAARAAFREGAANILNLVDAERVYLEARREVLQVQLEALAAGIEARLLLGEEISQ